MNPPKINEIKEYAVSAAAYGIALIDEEIEEEEETKEPTLQDKLKAYLANKKKNNANP